MTADDFVALGLTDEHAQEAGEIFGEQLAARGTLAQCAADLAEALRRLGVGEHIVAAAVAALARERRR